MSTYDSKSLRIKNYIDELADRFEESWQQYLDHSLGEDQPPRLEDFVEQHNVGNADDILRAALRLLQ